MLRVQDAEVDAGAIDRARHRAAERVDLLRRDAPCRCRRSRVAAHLPQRLEVLRQEQRAHAHAGRGERGLGAGVAAADDDATVASRDSPYEPVILGGARRRLTTKNRQVVPLARTRADCANMRRYADDPAAPARSPRLLALAAAPARGASRIG